MLERFGCGCGCGQLYRSIATTHPKEWVYVGASGLLNALVEPVQGTALWTGVLHFSEIMSRDRIRVWLPANRKPAVAIRSCPWRLGLSMGSCGRHGATHLSWHCLLERIGSLSGTCCRDERRVPFDPESRGLVSRHRRMKLAITVPRWCLVGASATRTRVWDGVRVCCFDRGAGIWASVPPLLLSRVGETLTGAWYGPVPVPLGSRPRRARR